MNFSGSGKATAEASQPAIWQALCDTRSGLNFLLVETQGLRSDMGVALGDVVGVLRDVSSLIAQQNQTLALLTASMSAFRVEVNALANELSLHRQARIEG